MLVVEHEPQVADLERLYLSREGYTVRVEHDGRGGLSVARAAPADLVVLDVWLPDFDGVDVHDALRAAGSLSPLLFVAASTTEAARVENLGLAPDGALIKPFSPRALLAKVRDRIRQSGHPAGSETRRAGRHQVGQVVLDLAERRVLISGRDVVLTVTEFNLLAFLMRRPGRVYTRDQLRSAVWGFVPVAGTRSVDVHVAQLRAKLGDASPIRTVRGVGYAAER